MYIVYIDVARLQYYVCSVELFMLVYFKPDLPVLSDLLNLIAAELGVVWDYFYVLCGELYIPKAYNIEHTSEAVFNDSKNNKIR